MIFCYLTNFVHDVGLELDDFRYTFEQIGAFRVQERVLLSTGLNFSTNTVHIYQDCRSPKNIEPLQFLKKTGTFMFPWT